MKPAAELTLLVCAALAMACAAPAPDASVQRLSRALSEAFDAPAVAVIGDSGRVLAITIDATPTPEVELRVAQFARAHYDSIDKLSAIAVRFRHEDRLGAASKTIEHRGGAFLTSELPVDTSPNWTQMVLGPTASPTLIINALRPVTDTVVGIGGLWSIVGLLDTTVDGHRLWRVAAQSHSASGEIITADVVTLDQATLRPLNERRTDAGGTITVHYAGAHLSIELQPHQESPLHRDTTFAAAPFSLTELPVLLSTLPLTKGFTTRLPVFHATSFFNGLDWVTILVRDFDTNRDAWLVDVAGVNSGFQRRWVNRTSRISGDTHSGLDTSRGGTAEPERGAH